MTSDLSMNEREDFMIRKLELLHYILKLGIGAIGLVVLYKMFVSYNNPISAAGLWIALVCLKNCLEVFISTWGVK